MFVFTWDKGLYHFITNNSMVQRVLFEWQNKFIDQLFQFTKGSRDRMVVGFTTTCAVSAYHHWYCEFRISIRVRCTALWDEVCQWLVTGCWLSPGPPVSSTNKIDRHDIAEILLKVALNTINQTKPSIY